MSSRKIRLTILCMTVALVMAPLGMSLRTTAQESTGSVLMQIAEESLNAQYQTLVSGDIDTALKGKRFGHLFRAGIGNQLLAHVAMRAALMKTRQDFKGFRTKLLFQEIQVNGDKAQLKATEITELDMDPPPGGPRVTTSKDPHVFEFAMIAGEWHLISDSIVRPAPVPPKGDLPSTSLPPPTTNSPPSSKLSRKHHADLSAKHSFTSPQPGNYDRYTAINYAKAHALSYNSAFKTFNNDCTNFVSQSLLAGGWQMVLGYYTHNDVWWYSCALPGGLVCHASYTWGAAYNFHEFLGTSPGQRTNYVSYFGDVDQGDIIFADWDAPDGHHPDGRIDHVMFVTGKDTEGNLYISQHTNDRLDRPMAQVILQEPAANFYGFKIKDSY
jgi:hypothetical protein